MSQRLHPRTGQPWAPVGFVNDRPVWPVLGGSEEDDKEDNEPDDDTSGADDGDNSEDDSVDDAKKRDPRIKELSDENARRRNEAKKLKKDLEDAQAKLKEIDDADKSEVERLTTEVEELRGKEEAAVAELREARLHNAFLTSNKYRWFNPDRALKLVDLSEVELDENGNVTGLDKALDALAKSDAYLIKSDSDDEGDSPKGPSGQQPRKPGKKELDRAALEKKYAALRR